MADYNEIFLESMQTLIDASLRQLPMDETVVCSIVDVSEREQGHYKVSPDGAVVYDAYSDKATYGTKDQVVVLIPKDDTVKRTIISRYVSNTTERPLAYVSEAEKIIKATDSLIDDTENTYCLMANGDTDVKKIRDIDLSSLSEQQILSDTIYLAADFQTLFTDEQQVNMRSGNYGLMLLAYKEDILVGQWVLDSSMMFGNPYAFVVPFRQEIALHYGDLIFDRLELNFYQQKNFIYFNGAGNIEVEQGIENLFVSNIELFLSWDIESVEDNTVKIYTTDNLGYNFDPTNTKEGINNRTVSLIFYNKDENNKYIGFEDGSFNEIEAQRTRAKIKNILEVNPEGYRYYLEGVTGNYFTKDKLTNPDGEDYEIGDLVYYTNEVVENIPTLTIETDKVAPTNSYWIKWYANNKNGAMDEVRNENEATDEESKEYESMDEVPEKNRDTIVISCRNNLLKTQVYAIVYCNGEQYISNTLEFENKGDLARNILSLQGINIVLEHGKNSQEAYALYDGITNSLLNPSEAYRQRKIEFAWTTNPGYAIDDAFWNGSTITWYLPKAGTMLQKARNDDSWSNKADENGFYIKEYVISNADYSEGKLNRPFCEYSICNNYLSACRNNTIRCVVKVPLTSEGEEKVYGTLEGSISFGFSAVGASGTDYTIVFIERENELQIRVLNKDGEEIDHQDGDIELRTAYSNGWYAEDYLSLEGITSNTYNLIEAKAKVRYNGMDVWVYGRYGKIIKANNAAIATIPGSIIYDSTGTNPIYYKGDWEFISDSEKTVTWQLHYYSSSLQKENLQFTDEWGIEIIEFKTKNTYGYLQVNNILNPGGAFCKEKDFGEEYKIEANNIYVLKPETTYQVSYQYYGETNIGDMFQYCFYDEVTNFNGLPQINDGKFLVPSLYVNSDVNVSIEAIDSTNKVIYNQPIYIGQNQHESALLNNWDGALQVDEKGNYILSAMMGAGHKEDNNTFTGVIMGDYAKLDSTNEAQEKKTGLFGFSEGTQTFELNTEGEVIIGGKGEIRSGNYVKPTNDSIYAQSGMKIDLSLGTINAKNFNLDENGNINITGHITATSGQIGNFEISKGALIYAVHEGQTTYYGGFDANPGSTNLLALGSTQKTFWGNAPFRVTKDGKLYANDAIINGTINATGGSIGNWEVRKDWIYDGYSIFGYEIKRNNGEYYGMGFRPNVMVYSFNVNQDLPVFAIGKMSDNWYGYEYHGLEGQWDTANFYVTANGILHASGAVITGNITANSIDAENIQAGTNTNSITFTNLTVTGNSIFKGDLTGSSGTFSGKLSGNTGDIGGWELGKVTIYKSNGSSIVLDNALSSKSAFTDSSGRQLNVALTPNKVYVWGHESDGSVFNDETLWSKIILMANK